MSKFFGNLLRSFFILLVGAYRTIGTTHMGGACRFSPSCSEYALQAFETLPVHKALFLVIRRILKCRPWGAQGYDPVPCCEGDLHARAQ